MGIVPINIGFSSIAPNTVAIADREVSLGAVPVGVQVAAFSASAIVPKGIMNGKLMGIPAEPAVGCDIVVRVEDDWDLIEAVGLDIKQRLAGYGYATRLWLLKKATCKYAYAYVRAEEAQ